MPLAPPIRSIAHCARDERIIQEFKTQIEIDLMVSAGLVRQITATVAARAPNDSHPDAMSSI